MNKKGISTIVATVLIVLITVAAVTILWTAISPIISQDLGEGTACFEAQSTLSVNNDRRYVCYYNNQSDGASDFINYSIKRNDKTYELEDIALYIDVDGNTYTNETGVTLEPNTVKTKGSGEGAALETGSIDINTEEVTLSVAPMILIDGEKTACSKTTPVEIRAC